MHSRLYYHLVWTTRGRQPTLDARSLEFLERYLPAVARQERARVIAIGAVRTHVHVLFEALPTASLPRLIQRFKGGSSVLINREGHSATGRVVHWTKGYALHTVGRRGLEGAIAYVKAQGERHPLERILPSP